jgi:hypothetical protein
MAGKSSGMAWTTLSVDDSGGTVRAIKNDVQSFQFAMPRGVLDVTGVDKSAIERILLLADFTISLVTTAINFDAAPSFWDCFHDVGTTSAQRTTTLVFASKTLAPEVLYTDFSATRGQDGSLGATVPGVLANGTAPTWS